MISRLLPERNKEGVIKNLHETMSEWSFEYCRKQISKNWQWNVINIGQQTVYSESKTYNYKNEINWESLKPNLNDLDSNKLITQDHHIVLALFNPSRYASSGMMDGIDLEKADGHYRSLRLLKNRIGLDQVEFPFYFSGEASVWKEIDLKNMDEFYKNCKL